MRAFGVLMSRMSGFQCTNCSASLPYFPLLSTMETARGGPQGETVTCAACQADMQLGWSYRERSLWRWFIGILPEIAVMVAVLTIVQWLLEAPDVSAWFAAAVVLITAALFLPLVMVMAILENRLNYRVQAADPLYDGRDDAERKDTV